MLLTTTTAAHDLAHQLLAALPAQVPNPGPVAPPGSETLTQILSYLKWIALGACAVAFMGGIIAFTNPLLAAGVLTLLLAISLIAAGLARLWIGWKHWSHKGSGWIIVAALITLACGILIALRWPVNSVWVLGMFLAIDMIFQGWAAIALGFALKSGRQN